MSASILDLETLAQPTEKILANLPPWSLEDAMSRLPKTHKKQETINAWIEEDKANHGKDAIEKAALNPETATIAIVGFWKEGRVEQLCLLEDGKITNPEHGRFWLVSEVELIEHAFMRLNEGRMSKAEEDAIPLPFEDMRRGMNEPPTFLGWNLIGFDLKMLIRRAWILGVKVPKSIYNPLSRYPIPERFVDMMDKYRAGSFKDPYTGLNAALKAMGLPEKGDGKEFGNLWREDRSKALAYNANELNLSAELFRRMGVDL